MDIEENTIIEAFVRIRFASVAITSIGLLITVSSSLSLPPQLIWQEAGPHWYTSNQTLWTLYAELTADSTGHGEVDVVSPFSGVSWLNLRLKRPEAGVLKKMSLAGLAKLSRLRCS